MPPLEQRRLNNPLQQLFATGKEKQRLSRRVPGGPRSIGGVCPRILVRGRRCGVAVRAAGPGGCGAQQNQEVAVRGVQGLDARIAVPRGPGLAGRG